MGTNAEFQYLEIPYGENVLAFLGGKWITEDGNRENKKKDQNYHFHNLMEIAVCRAGTGEIRIDQKYFSYQEGTVIVVPRNCSHAVMPNFEEESVWEYLYIKPVDFFEKAYPLEVRKRDQIVEETEERPLVKSKEDARFLAAELNLIMDQYRIREYGYKNCVNGLLYALLMEIVKINRKDIQKLDFDRRMHLKQEEVVGIALEYIEANFAKNLRMSDIAEAIFVSETYLRRLFTECSSISPVDYIKMTKIQKACEMLENNSVNINEIAYQIGYTNMATFIRHFKQITGETPKQWRKNKNQKKE